MERFMQRENVFLGHASSQSSSEELDFNDVFGGPPRRFSMQEVKVRYSFGETEEEKASLMEKPVFGEESTPRRRHQVQGNDFFDDIFRGNEEGYNSPRRGDGVFGSSPGSRIMSPAARPLNPKAEPYGTSLPSQFSLPAKLTKTTEFPTFSPINHGQDKIDSSTNGLNSPHSSSPLSRFSNQANEFKNVYQQSPLSSNEDSLRSEDSVGNQFHFSIYKWAGRGFPMLMPFVAKNNLKSKGLLKEELKGKKEIKKQLQSFLEESPEEKLQSSPNDDVFLDKDIGEKIDQKQVSKKIEEESQRLKPLLCVDFEQPEIKEKKATTTKGVDSNNAKVEESNLQSGAKNPRKSQVKGKVKEFVQIFNQEAPDSRTKATVLRKSQSLRWKNVEFDQEENEDGSNAANLKEKVNLSNVDKKPDVSLKVDENAYNNEEKRHSSTRTSSYPSNHSSTKMKKSFSSETFQRDSKISVETSDDPLEVNFQVQELSDDHENITPSKSSEDLKAIDAKIQQWSVGKKGNIRSLLSTLQYVVWPGSGWKAIPLVDLIEANSVKRAYQKALLRLHPDKLLQKGAASHQKYIAEKVFDILQEAWDHFNTLGAL